MKAVGGEVLDLALSRAKPHARFVICGGKSKIKWYLQANGRANTSVAISQYNSSTPQGPKVASLILDANHRS